MKDTRKLLSGLAGILLLLFYTACGSSSEDQQEKSQAQAVPESAPQVEKEASPQALKPVQKEEKSIDYPLPQALNFYGKAQHEDYHAANFYLVSQFRPIGWSKDGKLAYVVEPADQACGCYFFKIEVQDMVEDQVLWEWEYSSEEEGSPYQNLEEVWKGEYEKFKTVLNQQGILPLEKVDYQPGFKFSHADKSYRILLDLKQKKADWNYFDAITEESIKVESKGEGIKQVYSHSAMEFSLLMDANIAGVLKSPFEDRIAIVYRLENRGYEGPPNVLDCRLIGCDLGNGFKK